MRLCGRRLPGSQRNPCQCGTRLCSRGPLLSIIGQGEIEIEAATAVVDVESCVGARNVFTCPYTAIEFLADIEKAHVVEALCKGCGRV